MILEPHDSPLPLCDAPAASPTKAPWIAAPLSQSPRLSLQTLPQLTLGSRPLCEEPGGLSPPPGWRSEIEGCRSRLSMAPAWGHGVASVIRPVGLLVVLLIGGCVAEGKCGHLSLHVHM